MASNSPLVITYGHSTGPCLPDLSLVMGAKQTVGFKTTMPEVESELSEEELLLASCVVYGFSLSDKMWSKLY
jgi:hypothetical protein